MLQANALHKHLSDKTLINVFAASVTHTKDSAEYGKELRLGRLIFLSA